MGRKPIGERAMTAAERQRRCRERLRKEKEKIKAGVKPKKPKAKEPARRTKAADETEEQARATSGGRTGGVMHSIVREALGRMLNSAIDLWRRKQAGEDMTVWRVRFGDVYPMLLRVGSGRIPHDLFLEHGHSWSELMKAVAEREGKAGRTEKPARRKRAADETEE